LLATAEYPCAYKPSCEIDAALAAGITWPPFAEVLGIDEAAPRARQRVGLTRSTTR